MKFKGTHLLVARKFIYLSGKYVCYFKCKNEQEYLELEVTRNSGELNFVLFDKVDNSETTYSDFESGIIKIPLVNSHSYRLTIRASKAVGSYKASIKKEL